jgi:hypothetical protein
MVYMEPQTICRHCKVNISPSDYFCPNCGKKLREKPQSTVLLKQLLVYFISFFLPPLGLWPAIKYLKQPDQKSKTVGLIAVALTIISIALTMYLSVGLLNSLNEQINGQLDMYQNLGM